MLGHFTNRRRVYLILACAATSICLLNLLFLTQTVNITVVRLPTFGLLGATAKPVFGQHAHDKHPIANLMEDADREWVKYEKERSKSFRQTVARYRDTYGRHPPPGFKEWYMFARKNNAYHVDDFRQITGDLRPFWAIPPATIRQAAAKLQHSEGIMGVQVRNHKVVYSEEEGWRVETLRKSVKRLAQYLPDMDIALNTHDQPRVMLSWEDTQEHLRAEVLTRSMPPDAQDQFSSNMEYLNSGEPDAEGEDISWTSIAGKLYMDTAQTACPPGSPARNHNITIEEANNMYKSSFGGFVNNFTASSDLCVVGPALNKSHGFLFSASSNLITRKLAPVFSECKRYKYNSRHDYEWEDKSDNLIWRGVTSGGVQVADNWQNMHRQRFVQLANSTEMANRTVPILSETPSSKYQNFTNFNPTNFASEKFDVGFTEAFGCIPNCSFYDDILTFKKPKQFSETFKSKYLVDIDGHSFSGRWRAFQLSKSLGIKATIFREWHDSRLFAWRHFVPMDNRFDEFYSLMTYFIGLNSQSSENTTLINEPHIQSHDFEAEVIAAQSREWAQHALRNEDLDIYLYLLLLEYGRIIDDNRDIIGYSGDGSELDEFDAQHPFSPVMENIVNPPSDEQEP
ncbi:unnamed protein product [Penicillium bialowiezense]